MIRRLLCAAAAALGLVGQAHGQALPYTAGPWVPMGLTTGGPCAKNSGVTVSNGGLTFLAQNLGAPMLGSSPKIGPGAPGQYYLEAKLDSGTGGADKVGIGVCLYAATPANLNNTWTKGIAWLSNGDVDRNGSLIDSSIGSLAAGQTMQIAVDTVNQAIWFGGAAGAAFSASNPIWPPTYGPTTVYGYRYGAQLGTGPVDLALLFKASTSDQITLNMGGSAFTYVPPMGFGFGWRGAIPNKASYSRWDTGSAVGSLTYGPVSGSEYSFFGSGGDNGARSTLSYAASGKRYLEFSASQMAANGTYAGIADGSNGLANCNAGHCLGINAFGNAQGTLQNNQVGQLAVDLGGKLIWIRGKNADNWNNSGAANPATGVGGVSIAALTFPVYFAMGAPTFAFDAVIISNPSYMTYAAPSGFTAGW
jgi:hypothetical protein